MYYLRRLTILFLALMVTVSVSSPTFAARKRKVVKEETPVVEKKAAKEEVTEETPAPKKSTQEAPKAAAEPKRNEEVIFSFENDEQGWEIPDWAFEKPEDYVGESIAVSKKYADAGKGSLQIKANFPGKKWTAAYIEDMEYFNWADYSEVAVDVYVPEGAPVGLMGKIIVTQGEDWTWVEMRKPIPLTPGKWVTIRANLMPGSTDWRRVQPTDDWRGDIRKLGIRIESDKKPVYDGFVYIDNVRLTKIEK